VILIKRVSPIALTSIGLTIALALTGALFLAVVFVSAPGPARWVRTLHDSAHGPIFGCIAVLVLIILRIRSPSGTRGASAPWQQYLIALGVAVLLGGASELAQIPTGRDASFADLRHDVLGALGFLALFSVFDPHLRRRGELRMAGRAVIVLIGVCALVILASPMARALVEYHRRDAQFPVIADFTNRYDRYFVGQAGASIGPMQMPARWAGQPSEATMRVSFLPAPYPGIDFFELVPDWTAYSTLILDITNPTTTTLELSLLVMDAHHDYALENRFSTTLTLPPATRRRVRIQLRDIASGSGFPIDLAAMAGIVLFRTQGSLADEMYLSGVRLERP